MAPQDAASATSATRHYRLCHNNIAYQACNFAVPADDPNPLCVSCRQTRILPDLSVPDNRERWYRIEVAKRRLFYTLAKLGLVSVAPPNGERDGPVFEFLADQPGQQVLTGHCDGVITLNIAEADDAERVQPAHGAARAVPHPAGPPAPRVGPLLLGPADRDGGPHRRVPRDVRRRAGRLREALRRHYAAGGAPADWQASYVSAYATAHPWEDWAETWAHYLHMVDLLETAASYNTRLAVPGNDADEAEEVGNPFEGGAGDFDELVEQWVPLTLLLNSLNRSLGQDDAYPFALTRGAATSCGSCTT